MSILHITYKLKLGLLKNLMTLYDGNGCIKLQWNTHFIIHTSGFFKLLSLQTFTQKALLRVVWRFIEFLALQFYKSLPLYFHYARQCFICGTHNRRRRSFDRFMSSLYMGQTADDCKEWECSGRTRQIWPYIMFRFSHFIMPTFYHFIRLSHSKTFSGIFDAVCRMIVENVKSTWLIAPSFIHCSYPFTWRFCHLLALIRFLSFVCFPSIAVP